MKRKTIYFNQDNHHFYGCHPAADMTPEGVRRLVDVYAAPGTIRAILFCANVQRALFDSAVWERFRDIDDPNPLMVHLRLLAERGIDQFQLWLERCRELEIEGWLSMRMNDSHGLVEAATGADAWHAKWPSEYWRRNPQLRRAPYRLERSWEGSFNYLLPEVRAHHLRLVRELLERYDMYGLELDWMRWGLLFPPGFEREGRAVLTDMVREIRALADAAERRWGHPVRLGHRVPADLRSALDLGFDVPTWGREGWVDLLTLSSFLGAANFDPPVELWRALLPEQTVITAYVEAVAGPAPGAEVLNYDLLLGNAAAAWSCGADGIYLFNECYRESDHPEILRYLLEHVGSPEALTRTVRRLPVTYSQVAPAGAAPGRALPLPLRQSRIGADFCRMMETITVRLASGRTTPGTRCFLRLAFSAETPEAELGTPPVRVNTVPVARSSWPEYRSPVSGFPGVLRSELPEGAGPVLVYEVPRELLHETFNAVELLPPSIPGSLIWAELLLLPPELDR